MEPRNVIAGALEILADEKNWIKGAEDRQQLDDSGQLIEESCLWGAFKRAAIPGYFRGNITSEEFALTRNQVEEAAKLVGEVICEQYPDRSGTVRQHQEAVIPFNDHPETVHSEVIAILEKTLAVNED